MGGREGARQPYDLRGFLIPSAELVLGFAGCLAMVAGASTLPSPEAHLSETAFLITLVLFLVWFVVRLERGHLRLTMIGTQAAAMILSAPLAGVLRFVAVR